MAAGNELLQLLLTGNVCIPPLLLQDSSVEYSIHGWQVLFFLLNCISLLPSGLQVFDEKSDTRSPHGRRPRWAREWLLQMQVPVSCWDLCTWWGCMSLAISKILSLFFNFWQYLSLEILELPWSLLLWTPIWSLLNFLEVYSPISHPIFQLLILQMFSSFFLPLLFPKVSQCLLLSLMALHRPLRLCTLFIPFLSVCHH